MAEWISCEDKLPLEGKKVLIYLGSDEYKIADIRYGISEEEREKMKNGELDDPEIHLRDISGVTIAKRSSVFTAADQWGNNEKPYCFRIDNSYEIFGQRVKAWREIPVCRIEGD